MVSDTEKNKQFKKMFKITSNKHKYCRVHINQIRKVVVYACFSSIYMIKIIQSKGKPAHKNIWVDPLKRHSPKKGGKKKAWFFHIYNFFAVSLVPCCLVDCFIFLLKRILFFTVHPPPPKYLCVESSKSRHPFYHVRNAFPIKEKCIVIHVKKNIIL